MSKKEEILAALENGNELQIRQFFERNPRIDINAADRDGDTLLHHAIRSGNEGSVKALLDLHANPTIKNSAGQTPLEFAQALGGEIAEGTAFQLDEHLRIEMVRRDKNKNFIKNLVKGGADSLSKDLEGNSAIDLALEKARKDNIFKKAILAFNKASKYNILKEAIAETRDMSTDNPTRFEFLNRALKSLKNLFSIKIEKELSKESAIAATNESAIGVKNKPKQSQNSQPLKNLRQIEVNA